MSTAGQQVARALTEQFYRWELRGRGWMTWPQSVKLEPPFRPFEGHFVEQGRIFDDGRVESIGSRIAHHFRGFLGMPPEHDAELSDELIEEPEAEALFEKEGLVELQLALPPDYQPQANIFEQFLFSVGYAHEPIAFEVIGASKELVVQITAGATDAATIRQQLKAFFPEAVIIETREHLKSRFVPELESFSVVEFGLEREFMVPLQSLKALPTDPLVAVCGAMDRLEKGEAGIFQVLVEPVRNAWAASMLDAVYTTDGRPFFINDPELVSQTRAKTGRPLFAVGVRIAARAASKGRVSELIRAVAGALRPLGSPQGNRLVPLDSGDIAENELLADLLHRATHRSGMVLNSDEVVALIHLPTAAVRSKTLVRAIHKTRAAPDFLTRDSTGIFIGENHHEGVGSPVRLPLDIRLNHCHILGGTGSGKSTLLALMAAQDMQLGHGVAVIDPHGDLIDALLPHVPESRLDDVILFDPSDEDYAIAFNPLAASSTREKELLAGDFIAVMRQHTSAWGDQMSSLLGNAVLAFLYNSRTGTLPELRRFLVNPEFRKVVLQSVTHPEVAYYWEHEATLANKSAIGSILVRLDELLRSESLLHILGQRANKLDFGEIMDSGKIFLARLSKGLVGQANAYLLGGLLVSKFYQTTIARQSRQRENRRPYMLLMDEAGELLTSTISEILVGARKYGLGLTLAHQSLRQLTGDDEVYGAVTGSCGTKICFQVGGDDARKMADEFGGFQASDLMNLPKLHAIARVGQRDMSFNLQTRFLTEPPRSPDEAYADIRERTRKRYGTPTAEIGRELQALREFLPKPPVVDPFRKLADKSKKERDEKRQSPPETPPQILPASKEKPPKPQADKQQFVPAKPPESPKPAKAESVKNQIIQAAGGWGFSYETEYPVNGGTGRVDLVLTLGSLVVACEISATTSAEHEFERSVQKCLQAGFERIFLVCDVASRRNRIAELVRTRAAADQDRVHCVSTQDFLERLEELKRAASTPLKPAAGKTVLESGATLSAEERKQSADQAWLQISKNMARDRKR